jgi:hypothetical protein
MLPHCQFPPIRLRPKCSSISPAAGITGRFSSTSSTPPTASTATASSNWPVRMSGTVNPVENLWQFLRDNWLSNRVFPSYRAILDHCCYA